MLPFHSGPLWCVSLFGSLYFTVCKNRYTHSLIISQYSVGSSAIKKAIHDCSFFKFFCRTIREYFQYFQVAKVSDLIFLFSRFLNEVLRSSKTTVLCCRILTFWSNLGLKYRFNCTQWPLLYPWKPFWIRNLKVRENPVVPGFRAVWN